MKPTHVMIQALQRTAARLKTGNQLYRWTVPQSCNCGCLLQELEVLDPTERTCAIEKSPSGDIFRKLVDMVQRRASAKGGWWSAIDLATDEEFKICSATGLPVHELKQRLERFGFEKGDFYDIEFAGTIAGSDDQDHYARFRIPDYVGNYMLKKVDELKARRRAMAEVRLARMKARHTTEVKAEVMVEVRR